MDLEYGVFTVIEHKSSVDYNVVMQVLRYMVYIWEDYENRKEAECVGISKQKSFRYPPILPIVYYEDTQEWTSAIQLKERIFLSDVFSDYVPDYKYFLFKLQAHGKMEFLEKQDEFSLVMLINKLRDADEFRKLEIPAEYLDQITEKAPEDVLRVLVKVTETLLRRFHISEEEISELTDQVRRRKMGELFEHFEGFDLPKAREKAKRSGRAEGEELKLINVVWSMKKKGIDLQTLLDLLDEDIDEVTSIYDVELPDGTPYSPEAVYDVLHASEEETFVEA